MFYHPLVMLHRSTFTTVVSLSLACSTLWAAPEERVGLLLGLRAEGSYRTLWFTSLEGALALDRELDGIVFPHGSRFCKVVFRTVHTVDPDYAIQEGYDHVFVAVDCGGEPLPDPNPEIAPGCTGGGELELLFAGSAVLAQRYVESSSCYGRTNYYQALSVFPTETVVGGWGLDGSPIIGLDELGSEAPERLRRAAVEKCQGLSGEDRSLLEVEDCDEVQGAEQWAIVRDHGRWSVLGLTPGWRMNDLLYVVPLDLPKSILPSNGPALPWEAVVRSVPDAEDAVTSPGGGFALVMTPTAILRALVRDGELGSVESVAAKRAGEVVTTVEWATGRHVERWSEELEKGVRP